MHLVVKRKQEHFTHTVLKHKGYGDYFYFVPNLILYTIIELNIESYEFIKLQSHTRNISERLIFVLHFKYITHLLRKQTNVLYFSI